MGWGAGRGVVLVKEDDCQSKVSPGKRNSKGFSLVREYIFFHFADERQVNERRKK